MNKQKRTLTVKELMYRLSKFPPDFVVDFAPGENTDLTLQCNISEIEGPTSDGPGSIVIELNDKGGEDFRFETGNYNVSKWFHAETV